MKTTANVTATYKSQIQLRCGDGTLVAPAVPTRTGDGRFKSPQYAYVKGSLSRDSDFPSEGELPCLRGTRQIKQRPQLALLR